MGDEAKSKEGFVTQSDERRTEDGGKRDGVARIRDDLEKRSEVTAFARCEDGIAPPTYIRDVRFLERGEDRLHRVATAAKHREIAKLVAFFVAKLENAMRDPAGFPFTGFVFFAVDDAEDFDRRRRIARFLFRDQLARLDTVGGVEQRLHAAENAGVTAEILQQLGRMFIRLHDRAVIVAEDFRTGMAESIDRLVDVANAEEDIVGADQPDQLLLLLVDVLEFIEHHLAELAAQTIPYGRMALQHVYGTPLEVVEIERAALLFALGVEGFKAFEDVEDQRAMRGGFCVDHRDQALFAKIVQGLAFTLRNAVQIDLLWNPE